MTSAHLFESDIEFFAPETTPAPDSPAPCLPLARFIPRDGSPNRLLERYDPHTALELVTEQHQQLADWVRAQEWRNNVPKECWRYVVMSRRMKSCRNQLHRLVTEIEEGNE